MSAQNRARSITDEEDALQRKLESSANVERFQKALHLREVIRPAIRVSHRYREVEDVVHHASLKNILQKLIVIDGSTGLDLKDPSAAGCMGVRVEAFQYLALAPEKYGYDYLAFGGFPFLNSKSELF
jgi:hypothetical protein